ncbi:manganese efflux pump [Pseudogracilibacillus auburnensis]|uniref:Putative sporulation protein YtaF n=1 Tax=Pseudogracilibacillus auburnensis TaxID=1494959 RepID=A0A2V3VQH8_9BACI|nr:manganese efflux pump [Pseudogracilibacillus auburnensis]PXW83820.1 putative sporulation protein YtaF [Pseudogracilibacillus auburnensis]
MAPWFIIVVLTISSSIDNLGVGLSYGIRKIRISIYSNFLIAVICFLFSVTGIYFGLWIATVLPGILPMILGAIILGIIGIRIILLTKPTKEKEEIAKLPTNTKTSYIGWGESIMLGIALSANALTNGVGAGLLGFSPFLISLLAAIGSFVTVWAGVEFGVKLINIRIGKYTIGEFGTVISGVLLLIVAVLVFF